MSPDFMTRLIHINRLSASIDRLEVITLMDRVTHPEDGLLQLEADRTMNEIEETRLQLHQQSMQLYSIAKLN